VEVIVVDDGSTDGSREIIERYGSRIVAIFSKHSGQTQSVNTGFARCRGDVVMLLDADDVLLPDAAALHVARLAKPGVVRSNGYLLVADARLQPTGATIPNLLPDSGDYRRHAAAAGPAAYASSFTSGCAWSRGFLEQVMPLPRGTILGPDGYLTAADLFFGRIESIPQPVGFYRVHGVNKGPYGTCDGTGYLGKVLARYQERRAFGVAAAARAGVEIDARRWQRQMGWRLTMTCHALRLAGERAPRITLAMLALASFRGEPRCALKRLGLSAASVTTKLLPRAPALALAKHLLQRSFGHRHARGRPAALYAPALPPARRHLPEATL
jgi:glycosyltransferase involved in cell wall biosynthesis